VQPAQLVLEQLVQLELQEQLAPLAHQLEQRALPAQQALVKLEQQAQQEQQEQQARLVHKVYQ
jgi:hypothetical protein